MMHHAVAKQLEDLHQIPPDRRTRGQRIRAARLRLGWSQEALACDLGLSGPLVAKMERDEQGPSPRTTRRVLEYVERQVEVEGAPPLPPLEPPPPLPPLEPPPPLPPGASYGEILQHARLVAGLTQDDVARHIGTSDKSISDVERGQRRALADWYLPALADLLGHDTAQRLAHTSLRLSGLTLRVEDDDDPRAPLAAELAVQWDTLTDEQIARLRAVLTTP